MKPCDGGTSSSGKSKSAGEVLKVEKDQLRLTLLQCKRGGSTENIVKRVANLDREKAPSTVAN